jgi:hypothetical protein
MDDQKSNVISLQDRKPSVFQTKLNTAREISKRARSGGRCLDAVWERTDISTSEKAVLCQIGAFHDYRDQRFTGAVRVSVKRIAARTSMEPRSVRRILKHLIDKGLLLITHAQKRSGADDASIYRICPRIFSDYARSRIGSSVEGLTSDHPPATNHNQKGRGGVTSGQRPLSKNTQKNRGGDGPDVRGGVTSGQGGTDGMSDLFPIPISYSYSKKQNPSEVGGDCEERKITLAELEGSMLSLYGRYTQPKVISALIRTMLRKRSASEILMLIEEQRRSQDQLLEWSHHHTDIWLRKLEAWKDHD